MQGGETDKAKMSSKAASMISSNAFSAPSAGEAKGACKATEAKPADGATRLDLPTPFNAEVCPRESRRRFTLQTKLRILREAAACKPGELGALLRREGIYYSTISKWRMQQREGRLNEDSHSPQRAAERQNLLHQMAALENENRRLMRKLRQAEIIIDAQKKIAEILQTNDPTEKSN